MNICMLKAKLNMFKPKVLYIFSTKNGRVYAYSTFENIMSN